MGSQLPPHNPNTPMMGPHIQVRTRDTPVPSPMHIPLLRAHTHRELATVVSWLGLEVG